MKLHKQKDLLDKAILLHNAGKLKEAEFLYKKVIKNYDQDYIACINLAVIFGQRKDWIQMIQYIKVALAIQPKAYQPLSMFSYALNQSGQFDKSIQNTIHALECFPENDHLYILNFSCLIFPPK